MNTIGPAFLAEVMTLEGALSCALIDIETGACLCRAGVAVAEALEFAGLLNARILRSQLRLARDQYNQGIEDFLITLDRQYHLIRLLHDDAQSPSLFLYLVLDKPQSNLAMARRKMAQIEREMLEQSGQTATRDTLWQGDKTCLSNAGGSEEEIPAFMQNDVAMKLLGIDMSSFDLPLESPIKIIQK